MSCSMPPVHSLWSCLIWLGACSPELRPLVAGGGVDVVRRKGTDQVRLG